MSELEILHFQSTVLSMLAFIGKYGIGCVMNDNDIEIDLFRHHNGNNTNIKVIFKEMTMLHKCNCI